MENDVGKAYQLNWRVHSLGRVAYWRQKLDKLTNKKMVGYFWNEGNVCCNLNATWQSGGEKCIL